MGKGRVGYRWFRVARAIDRRHGFLVSCRAVEGIAWYLGASGLFSSDKPGAALVSSDSNPEELGFLAAALAHGIPRIFVSHAYPTPLSPPLDFDLSILEGEAALEARRRKGPVTGQIVLAGVEGESAPMAPRRFGRANPTVGIFTPKALSWSKLIEVVDDCRRHHRPARIVIRWHPSMLEPPRLASRLADLSGIDQFPGHVPLSEVARLCDWVVADENSNVHLPVMRLGIPTIPVRNLGIYPLSHADQYGFVANRVVFPSVASLAEVPPEAVVQFFEAGWAERFARYDASYLHAPDAVSAEVRRAIDTLIAGAAVARAS